MTRILTIIALLFATPVGADDKPLYSVQHDIIYGSGIVDATTNEPRRRPMRMDAYLPEVTDNEDAAYPAIIMAFGGAYHRGGKRDYRFTEDGAQDSSMADYCRALAARKIACFSIDYRLTQDDAAFPKKINRQDLMPKKLLNSPLVTGRVELVRRRMGLPPLDDKSREQLWNATFAAVEDMQNALGFVRANAARFNINGGKIALGGFSAGAMTAINLAYGVYADVAAVVSLSGTNWGYNLNKTLKADAPPLLLFAGQWDLPGIRTGSGMLAQLFDGKNIPHEQAWVPGFGHFYPMQAPSLSARFEKSSVIERMERFLHENFTP